MEAQKKMNSAWVLMYIIKAPKTVALKHVAELLPLLLLDLHGPVYEGLERAATVTVLLFLKLSGWHLSIHNVTFYTFCTSKLFHDKKKSN